MQNKPGFYLLSLFFFFSFIINLYPRQSCITFPADTTVQIDTSIRIDTTIRLDTTIRVDTTVQIDTTSVDTNKTIIEDLKDYSEKNTFLAKLLRDIIVQDEAPSDQPAEPEKKVLNDYSGRIIRSITIVNLEVFGTSVDHPQDSAKSWFQKTGNSLHINSKDWIIKNQLIFSEGELLIPFYIQESERLIRLNSYIHDVRITPKPISKNSDSVDIIVYVQDKWSINGGASIGKGNSRFRYNDINFLGYGGEFKVGFQLNDELVNGWDWDGSYVISNLQDNFLSGRLFYASEKNKNQFGISAGRDFVTPVIQWAGGIAQEWYFNRVPYGQNGVLIYQNANFHQQDYWLGYAFDFKDYDQYSDIQNRFNVAGRITKTAYSQKPALDSVNLFQDNTFLLGRIGFSYRTYYQDSYVFGFGSREDIPLVKMIELLIGVEEGVNNTRQYYGLRTGYSFFSFSMGHLFGGFETGVFRNNGKWDSRNSIVDLLYFSNMKTIGKIGWRHYAELRYSQFYDLRNPFVQLNINNERGLRGFSDEVTGNKKIVLNYEADIFIPLKFLGFKLAVITFADFGLLSGERNSFFKSKLYQGYGIGFRLKNENLIFPPIQFMMGYYPNSFTGGGYFNFFQQNSMYYQLNRFQFSSPNIIRAQ